MARTPSLGVAGRHSAPDALSILGRLVALFVNIFCGLSNVRVARQWLQTGPVRAVAHTVARFPGPTRDRLVAAPWCAISLAQAIRIAGSCKIPSTADARLVCKRQTNAAGLTTQTIRQTRVDGRTDARALRNGTTSSLSGLAKQVFQAYRQESWQDSQDCDVQLRRDAQHDAPDQDTSHLASRLTRAGVLEESRQLPGPAWPPSFSASRRTDWKPVSPALPTD